jgi:capsular polysaccharide biosynthesis protein
LIDELPNLIRIRDENPHCNGVIVHTTMPQWALELLSYFHFDIYKINERAVVAENLLAVSAPRAIVGKNLENLRRQIETKPEMTIVVSRKGSPRSNDEIEKEIVRRIPGALLVDPGDFTVEEQIRLFSSARAMIGLHGGALTNCIWMDKSSKLVEIFNHAYRTSDYARLCIELGIRYYGVETENMNPEQVGSVVEAIINEI